MIIKWHKFDYSAGGNHRRIQAHIVVEGDDPVNTAMSKTVGIPLAVTTKLLIEEKIKVKGVEIPTNRKIYKPVLEELSSMGFTFVENEYSLDEVKNPFHS